MPKSCDIPLPEKPTPGGEKSSTARQVYEILIKQIIQFESTLTESEEIGVKLVTGPGEQTFNIGDIFYQEPELVIFCGKDSQRCSVRLIQHYTQLSVFLIAAPLVHDEAPNRIGFLLEQRLKKKPAPRRRQRK